METIQVDDQVFGALDVLGNVAGYGETKNAVLRKLLNLSAAHTEAATPPSAQSPPIQVLVDSTEFRFAKGVVGRFLVVMSWLYKENSESFSSIENVRGRGRLYFATTSAELERSGTNVNPKKIPGTPYWVITTTPTDLKQEILRSVMKVLGYDKGAIRIAVNAIAR